MNTENKLLQRRRVLQAGGAALATLALPPLARAQEKLRVGLMLPYTGTYAALGTAITNGFKLAVEERGGKLGGREIEYFSVDDESEPAKAPENANRLVSRDKVDVLVGTVHSGVVMGMLKVAKETGVPLLIPNAGLDAATGALCAPNVFRTSFTNWQASHAVGKLMWEKGHKKVVFITWKYGAGEDAMKSVKEGFEKQGGQMIKELWVPFPQVEFQALLTEIAAIKPDAVACFFAGGGAAKFIKDYAAAGLKEKIPLYSSGFLTDGVLDATGTAAEGLLTTLHYGDSLDLPKNNAFRLAYAKKFKLQPDVYGVQGYDTAQLLAIGLDKVKGNIGDRKAFLAGMEGVVIDSPRGKWTMSRAHNPIQDIYLRRVEKGENKVVGVIWKALADPARGCKM